MSEIQFVIFMIKILIYRVLNLLYLRKFMIVRIIQDYQMIQEENRGVLCIKRNCYGCD